MLIYRAELKLKKEIPKEDVLNLISRSNEIEAGSLPAEEISAGDRAAWLLTRTEKYNTLDTLSIVYDMAENTVCITRDYSTNNRNYHGSGNIPVLVKMIVGSGYLAEDHGLEVDALPHEIGIGQYDFFRNIIMRKVICDLPVVYVSVVPETYDHLADIRALATYLQGTAHVLYEKHPALTDRLLANNINAPRNGWICIWYPNRQTGFSLLRPNKYVEKDDLTDDVINIVFNYQAKEWFDDTKTYAGVRRLAVKQNLEELESAKTDAENETQTVYSTFSDELDARDKEIAYLKERVSFLNSENMQLRSRFGRSNELPLLMSGGENDHYPNEVKAMILNILEEALANAKDDSRRQHVLEDILSANRDDTLQSVKERCENLKRDLYGCKNTQEIVKVLRTYGFDTVDDADGKHIKLRYANDPRYTFPLAKTTSDTFRATKNLTALIINSYIN